MKISTWLISKAWQTMTSANASWPPSNAFEVLSFGVIAIDIMLISVCA